MGLLGGFVIANLVLDMSAAQYWNSAWQAIEYSDIFQGLIKPFSYAFIIALVGCYYGMKTTGGTQGVGLATTRAVVVASVWIFVLDLFITRFFVSL